MNRVKGFCALAGALLATGFGMNGARADSRPAIAHPAPAFTLKNMAGKPRTLKEFRGRPVALFFFCDCSYCERCAETWAQVQRSGELAGIAGKRGGKAAPITVAISTLEPAQARQFQAATGLDPAQTVLISEPDVKTALAYDALPCPRVFVLDTRGIIRYINNEEGAKSNTTPAPLLVSRIMDSLRKIAAAPPGKSPSQSGKGGKKRGARGG